MNIKKGDKVTLVKRNAVFGWEKSLKIGKVYTVYSSHLFPSPAIRIWITPQQHWGLPAECFKLARAIDEQLLFPFMYD